MKMAEWALPLLLLASATASASDTLIINIIQSAPFGYVDEHGKRIGTHIDYFMALSAKTKIPMEIRLVPRARIIANLASGRADATIMFRSESRDPHVSYVSLIRDIKIVALGHKQAPLQRYEDLYRNMSVGVLRQQRVSRRFDKDELLYKMASNNYEILMKMLIGRRVGSIVGNAIALWHVANQLGVKGEIDRPGLTLATKQQWLQFSKKSKHIDKVKTIQQAITELKADGTLDEILTSHVGDDWERVNGR